MSPTRTRSEGPEWRNRVRRPSGALAVACRAALDVDQRAFRARVPAVLADALPFAAWKRHGYGTNRKPVARRPLPGGGEEKWFRAEDVFKRKR